MVGGCESASQDSTRSSGFSPDPNKPAMESYLAAASGFVPPPMFTGPLVASSNTVPHQGSFTLSISTNVDVGPTPYYTQIFNLTSLRDGGAGSTGFLVASCASGTTCSTTTQKPDRARTLITYAAYVGGWAAFPPPPNVVATSPKTYVAVASTGFTVSLPTTANCVANTTGQITATANQDMGPTPYWIEIFDQFENRLGVCGYGTTCTASYQCGSVPLTAFISDNTPAFPPTGVQAASNTVVPLPFVP
jgi:hypothetical protein